jgi:hypothetical protein
MVGERVTTFINKTVDAGAQTLNVEVRKHTNEELTEGVYFVKVIVGERVYQQKVIKSNL